MKYPQVTSSILKNVNVQGKLFKEIEDNFHSQLLTMVIWGDKRNI